jgi:hypothetical protein
LGNAAIQTYNILNFAINPPQQANETGSHSRASYMLAAASSFPRSNERFNARGPGMYMVSYCI